MRPRDWDQALERSVEAAKKAGAIMRRELRSAKKIDAESQFDIKLALDVRCQKIIESHLARRYPHIAVVGEEGDSGEADGDYRWVIDPIDGTVNFAYGIPHACVSVALQRRSPETSEFESVTGAVYDPFMDELFTAVAGKRARLNGRTIHVSDRGRLSEAIVTVGFAKSKSTMRNALPYFNLIAQKVRKVRIMGSAALGLAYVASGRFDAYVEGSIRLWDVAAGGLLVAQAGGVYEQTPHRERHRYAIVACNARLRRKLPDLEL